MRFNAPPRTRNPDSDRGHSKRVAFRELVEAVTGPGIEGASLLCRQSSDSGSLDHLMPHLTMQKSVTWIKWRRVTGRNGRTKPMGRSDNFGRAGTAAHLDAGPASFASSPS